MYNQYKLRQQKTKNSYDSCLEGLRINPLLYSSGLELALKILSQKFKFPEDHIVVISIFSKILDGISSEALPLLMTQIKFMGNKELYDCFEEALKVSRIIISR